VIFAFRCVLALILCANVIGADRAFVVPSQPPPLIRAAAPFGPPALAGLMTDARLIEFSGLAPARQKNRFWAINDGGEDAVLWQIDEKGRIQEKLQLQEVTNIDFEDLASFSLKDASGKREYYVAIGDIGDNAAVLPERVIYVVPDAKHRAKKHRVRAAWQVRFRYPDGPHDAESLTVDAERGYFYIVNKRVTPPVLYRLPLRPSAKHPGKLQTAERIGALSGLPAENLSSIDTSNAVRFGSQATGAVMGCDGNELLLLTYAAVYRYQKTNSVAWSDALAGQVPQVLPLPPTFQAEAVTLSRDCKVLYVGGEKVPGPLWRFQRLDQSKQALKQ
jgi:hypothetical protein